MFKLQVICYSSMCQKASVGDPSQLWHLRRDHLNFGGLEQLHKKNVVLSVPYIHHPNQICEYCMYGKQSRMSFPKESISQASQPLELVYADICGPLLPSFLGRNKYFLLFINDCAEKSWVYFFKEKSEALEAFKKFKAQVENETGCLIKAL